MPSLCSHAAIAHLPRRMCPTCAQPHVCPPRPAAIRAPRQPQASGVVRRNEHPRALGPGHTTTQCARLPPVQLAPCFAQSRALSYPRKPAEAPAIRRVRRCVLPSRAPALWPHLKAPSLPGSRHNPQQECNVRRCTQRLSHRPCSFWRQKSEHQAAHNHTHGNTHLNWTSSTSAALH